MPVSQNGPKKSASDRFRSILSAAQKNGEDETSEAKRPLVLNLPKARPSERTPRPEAPSRPEASEGSAPPWTRGRLFPAFWTAASLASLAFNLILLGLLLALVRSIGGLDPGTVGSGVLGGLYANFERMDQAHIKAVIPVQTAIPLSISIPVQTTTGIVLAQDVVIRNARVRISTASFNIDSPAEVTLPAGTALNVVLDFSLPVAQDVPVSLNIPVDIALKDTELHPAIRGLQDTLRPLYCMVNPLARSLRGEPLCP